MALAFGEMEEWEPEDAEFLVSAMVDYLAVLETLEEGIRSASDWGAAWTGSSGEKSATARVNSIGDYVTDLAANAAAMKEIGIDTNNAVTILKFHIDSAISYANSNQFSIDFDGNVIDNSVGEFNEAEVEQRGEIKRNIEQSVREILQTGRAIEERAASGLSAIQADLIDDGGVASVSDAVSSQTGLDLPANESTPYEVKAWWSTLSESEKLSAIEKHHEQLGSLVGVPQGARHQANLKNLDDQENYWQDRLDKLRRRIEGSPQSGSSPLDSTDEILASSLESEKLADLRAIRRAVVQPDGKPIPDRSLLQVDSIDEPVTKAIVVDGDITRATNVAMNVPGYTTNPRDSLVEMANNAQRQRYDAATIGKIDREDVATVSFMGYEAPQKTFGGTYQVTQDDMAVEGAPLVANELRGIEAVNQNPDLHLVANGHSYGSSTLGIAMQELSDEEPTPVDDVVFYGSPGIPDQSPAKFGPFTYSDPEPSDLGVREGHAFNMAASTDPIVDRNLGGFVLGPSPESYGAIPLSTDDEFVSMPNPETGEDETIKTNGAPLVSGTHSSYPRAGYTSAYLLAAILAGRTSVEGGG